MEDKIKESFIEIGLSVEETKKNLKL